VNSQNGFIYESFEVMLNLMKNNIGMNDFTRGVIYLAQHHRGPLVFIDAKLCAKPSLLQETLSKLGNN
jgi:hypothetical protein